MKKLLLSLSLFLATSATMFAIPAKPGVWRTLTLSDGTTVSAMLKGDEFAHYYQAADGRCFVASPSDAGVFVKADMDAMMARARKRQAMRAAAHRNTRRLAAAKAGKQGVPGYVGTYEGVKKGLIILAEFADKSFAEGNDRAKFNDIANKDNYTSDDGYIGSIRDYFKAQSSGRFYIDFDVVGPVKLANKYAYYGENDIYGNDMRCGQMVAEACKAVDEQVDFSKYDWDNTGEANQIYVIYAGLGEATSAEDPNTIWPHQWQLRYSDNYGALNLDGVVVDKYACSNELYSDDGVKPVHAGLGPICHEFSHCLGLMDLYDVENGRNFGMDVWSLMDGGSYNGNSFRPCGYTSYEKAVVGWLDPIVLKNDTAVGAHKALSDDGEAYIIYNDNNRNEFLLLENRQQTGWDTALYGSGLLVLHVDYDEAAWNNNVVNVDRTRQRCTIFHADNNSLRSVVGIAGDPYPYEGNDSLTNLSKPAAKFYNANTDGTKYANCSIYDIKRNADGTMSFKFKGAGGTNTAITEVELQAGGSRRIYTLGGQYAGSDLNSLPKGVYVVGGRKIVK